MKVFAVSARENINQLLIERAAKLSFNKKLDNIGIKDSREVDNILQFLVTTEENIKITISKLIRETSTTVEYVFLNEYSNTTFTLLKVFFEEELRYMFGLDVLITQTYIGPNQGFVITFKWD